MRTKVAFVHNLNLANFFVLLIGQLSSKYIVSQQPIGWEDLPIVSQFKENDGYIIILSNKTPAPSLSTLSLGNYTPLLLIYGWQY